MEVDRSKAGLWPLLFTVYFFDEAWNEIPHSVRCNVPIEKVCGILRQWREKRLRLASGEQQAKEGYERVAALTLELSYGSEEEA